MTWLTRICLLLAPYAIAVGGSEPGIPVRYVGGTLNGCALKSSGRLYLPGPQWFLFRCGAGEVKVEYETVTSMRYGQTLHRRFGTAAATAVVPPLWPVTAAVMLVRSHKHFITIEYAEAGGAKQALIVRVEKENIRTVLTDLEALSKRRFEYQDKNAAKTDEGRK